ncbi:MAG TPA: cupin domain-containing protein [Bacteroidales bacterium]|nr:cupin domain-containing protein [Bacteroidales bacterium]
MKRIIPSYVAYLIIYFTFSANGEAQYLKRSLSSAPEVKIELSTGTAHYSSLFGEGDDNSGIIRGVSRYGRLVIDPGGSSNPVKYDNEEQILFIMGGTGILRYGNENIPVTKNDFMHIPGGMKFSLSNPRDQSLSVILMGFKLKPGICSKNTSGLMIANTDEVKFQTLPSHGPTTQFQLLMGTTESTRDRLEAACQVTSLFIMDFASGGTNNPHNHRNEEEIYLILKGKGDIVAGKKDDGSDMRYPSVEGDIYFYSPSTQIGFYSGNKEEEEHARILAVRFNF